MSSTYDYLSREYYTADGTTDIFPVTFPYLNKMHVKVRVGGGPALFKWLNSGQIQLLSKPSPGETVQVYRETPVDNRVVNYTNGAMLTEEELNNSAKQNFYISQELKDTYERILADALGKISQGQDIPGSYDDIISQIAAEVLTSELYQDLNARIKDIDLNAESILEQTTRLDGFKGTIENADARIDDFQLTIDQYAADLNEIDALLVQETDARIDGDTALANTLDLIGAKSGDGLSFIMNTNSVKVSSTESFAQKFSGIDTRMGENEAAILSEQTARVNQDNVFIENFSLLGARSNDGSGYILNTDTVRLSETESLATRLTGLQSSIGDNEANLIQESQTRADADTALSNDFTQLAARVGDAEADIVNEQQARATADSALASDLSLLGAKTTDGSAWSLDMTTVKVSGGEALGTYLGGLETAIGDNESAIVNEQTVRSDADSALAQDISQVQSSVGNLSTTVQTHSSSIDGLEGKYTVKIDNNGYVSGFGLASTPNVDGTPFSEFTILADRFAIVTPGENPVVPFVADAGGVYMPNAFIRDLQVEKINGGDVNALWNLGSNGRIVMDSGTHMKVIGLGFGQYGNLVEWYGPKMAISSMNTSNSITHATTNGDTYFGGTLSVGTLSNSTQSTDLTTSAIAELGPYSSNGGNITIVWSYIFSATYLDTSNSTCSSSYPQPTATLELQRSLNGGGSWSTIHTKTVNGTTTCESQPEEFQKRTREDMSASFTYTDTLQSTTDRTYRVVLTYRGTYHAQANVTKQVISITSTE